MLVNIPYMDPMGSTWWRKLDHDRLTIVSKLGKLFHPYFGGDLLQPLGVSFSYITQLLTKNDHIQEGVTFSK